MQKDSFSRIPKVPLATELVHIMSYDFTRGSHVLRKQLVRERNHLYRSIFRLMSEPFRETNQRASKAPRDVVDRKAFDAAPEVHGTLDEKLQQGNGEFGPARSDFFDFGRRPGHYLRIFQSNGNFGPLRQAEKRRLAKKLIRLININHNLSAIVGHPTDLDLPVDHEINTR